MEVFHVNCFCRIRCLIALLGDCGGGSHRSMGRLRDSFSIADVFPATAMLPAAIRSTIAVHPVDVIRWLVAVLLAGRLVEDLQVRHHQAERTLL